MEFNQIQEFIVTHYKTILFVIFAIEGWYLMGKENAKKVVIEVMLQAEKHLAVIGEEKKGYVIERAYDLMPAITKPFISKKLIGILVEEVLEYIKEDYEKRA